MLNFYIYGIAYICLLNQKILSGNTSQCTELVYIYIYMQRHSDAQLVYIYHTNTSRDTELKLVYIYITQTHPHTIHLMTYRPTYFLKIDGFNI